MMCSYCYTGQYLRNSLSHQSHWRICKRVSCFKLLRSVRYYTFLFGNSHRLYTQRMMKIASDPFRRPSRSKVVGSNETTPIRCCLCLVTFKLGKWYRDWSFVMIVYRSLKLLGPSYGMNVHECVFKLRMMRTRSNIHIAELEREMFSLVLPTDYLSCWHLGIFL